MRIFNEFNKTIVSRVQENMSHSEKNHTIIRNGRNEEHDR